MQRVRFRPHHFLCALGFQGKGYSPEFVKNFAAIVQKLAEPTGTQIEIEVTEGLDSVCEACPNHDGVLCTSQHKVGRIDRSFQTQLGLVSGQVLNWAEAKKLLSTKLSVEAFEQACAPCAWKSMGVCQRALEDLKDPK